MTNQSVTVTEKETTATITTLQATRYPPKLEHGYTFGPNEHSFFFLSVWLRDRVPGGLVRFIAFGYHRAAGGYLAVSSPTLARRRHELGRHGSPAIVSAITEVSVGPGQRYYVQRSV